MEMESSSEGSSSLPLGLNDGGNGDVVVVQIKRNEGGSVEYECGFHSSDLVGKSKYFKDRLLANPQTHIKVGNQIYVVVKCKESGIEHFKTVLKLLNVQADGSGADMFLSGVHNTIGVLEAAIHLECPQIITSCVEYLEAVPWTEDEMAEIYGRVSDMEAQVEPILSRIKPVDSSVMTNIMHSAIKFTTLSLPPSLNGLKASVWKLLEKYKLNETDAGAPLVVSVDGKPKEEALPLLEKLFSNFNELVDSFVDHGDVECLVTLLEDTSSAIEILEKSRGLRPIVCFWLDNSEQIVNAINHEKFKVERIKANIIKAFEVTAKILEAVGNGSVILSTAKRHSAVMVWLPFVSNAKLLMDGNSWAPEIDGEICRSLESAFNDVILTLPLSNQAEILNEWLANKKRVEYPNLIKAFEAWCSRSKYAIEVKSSWDSGMPWKDDGSAN